MPHKEIHKIIRVGNASFGIILPRAWIRYYNLKHKDKLEIISNSEITIKRIEPSEEEEK